MSKVRSAAVLHACLKDNPLIDFGIFTEDSPIEFERCIRSRSQFKGDKSRYTDSDVIDIHLIYFNSFGEVSCCGRNS